MEGSSIFSLEEVLLPSNTNGKSTPDFVAKHDLQDGENFPRKQVKLASTNDCQHWCSHKKVSESNLPNPPSSLNENWQQAKKERVAEVKEIAINVYPRNLPSLSKETHYNRLLGSLTAHVTKKVFEYMKFVRKWINKIKKDPNVEVENIPLDIKFVYLTLHGIYMPELEKFEMYLQVYETYRKKAKKMSKETKMKESILERFLRENEKKSGHFFVHLISDFLKQENAVIFELLQDHQTKFKQILLPQSTAHLKLIREKLDRLKDELNSPECLRG